MSEQQDEKQEQEVFIAGVEEDAAPEFVNRYLDSVGKPRPDLWRIGIDELNIINTAPAVVWQEIGPDPLNNLPLPADSQRFQGVSPVGGEVTDIAIDVTGAADTTVYAATNNGGIWKSIDGGATWAPTSDGMPSLSMGAVAMEAGNQAVLYAGSGNLFDGQGGFIKASGLYKSVDAGTTWFVADGGVFGTTFAGIGINRIVSTAADALLVGTDHGLFRSTDGGRNFGANAPNFDDGKPVMAGFVTALAMDTAVPNRAWVAIRGLDDKLNPFPGGGLFQLTLNPEGSITPSANLLNNAPALVGVRVGSIVFAQSTQFPPGTANSGILYAAVQDTPQRPAKPFFVGLFRSTDSGLHWTPLPNLKAGLVAANEDNQSNYDFTLGVDPQNADLVYAGFKQVWRSLNGTTGAAFAPCSVNPATQNMVHWDQHELVFSPSSHWGPGAPTTVYVGTDGGIARSTDGGNTWVQLNAGMRTHLFVGIDVGRGATNQVTFGGTQDNGTPGHRPGDALDTWLAGIDGDGGVVAVDPANSAIVYGFDNKFLTKTSDGGNHWAKSKPLDSVPITNATQATPIQVTAVGHLFLDGQVVNISGVQGNTAANGAHPVVIVDADNFRLVGTTGNGAYTGGGTASGVRIGRGLTNPDSSVRRVALVPNGNQPATTVYVAENKDLRKSTDAGANFAATVKHFDNSVFALVCPDANRVWVGTGDGNVHLSSDAGVSWKDFSPGGAGPVTGIAVDPGDMTRVVTVYAGFSGIDRNLRTRHCFLTTNEGTNWTDTSGTDLTAIGNLPDLPLHSVVFDSSTSPSTIVVASDAAVLQSANNGATWERLGAGLPATTCRSLAIDNTDVAISPRVLRLGTYGRSCFELARLTGARLLLKVNFAFGAVRLNKKLVLSGTMFNVGDAAVTFTSFTRTAGDPDFDFDISPDLSPLAPGGSRSFSIHFAAAGDGIRSATFALQTNDALHSFIQIPATGITLSAGKPRLAVKASFQFGEVDRGATRTIRFNVANTGLDDLTISQFALTSNGEFILSTPPVPLTLGAGEDQRCDLIYAPNTWGGNSKTTVHIASNDPRQPTLDIPAIGSAPRNFVLIIGLIVLGAAVIVGGAEIYEHAKRH